MGMSTAPVASQPRSPDVVALTSAPIRGEHGLLALRAERVGDRTRLVDVRQRPPLAMLRAHYLDPAVPDMAFATIVSAAGGVLQGDDLRISVSVGPGARLRLGTQSATRLYRTPDASVTITTEIEVEAGGHLEVVPDPYLPYAGARVELATTCDISGEASLIVTETIAAGRVARGESLAFERIESMTRLRVDGIEVARDAMRLDPLDGLSSPGRLGRYGVIGTLFAVSPSLDASVIQATLEESPIVGTWAGASTLPDGAGVWLRVLATDPSGAAAVIGRAEDAARIALLGAAAPPDRRP